MKYCPRCKLRMPGDASVCKQCAGPLRTVGESAASHAAAGQSGAEPDLTMQLQGLQHEVRRSRLALLLAAALALLLCVAFVLLLAWRHFSEVLQYAEVAELDVHSNPGSPGEAEIRFVRRSAGKVEFVRATPGRTETLIDHGYHDFDSKSPEKQFVWSGSDDDDFSIRVRVREGWRTRDEVWAARGGRIVRAQ